MAARSIVGPHLGSRSRGGVGSLIPVWWEEGSDLEVSNSGGRQWAMGHSNEGTAFYVPEDMDIAYLELEIHYKEPSGSTDIIQGQAKVQLQLVGDDDLTDDTDLELIDGTELVIGPVADGSRKRHVGVVTQPKGIVIRAGSWIRPVTTAPQNAIAADTGNRSAFTCWLRQR